MSELPKGWVTTTLGELADVIRGVTYKKEQAKASSSKGLVPLLRATNISQELDFDELVYVPERNVSDLQMLRQGDVVIAASSGSKSVVGKAAILKSEWIGTFGAFCAAVRPNQGIAAQYLASYMQTREYRSYISTCSAGVNINNLKASDLSSFELLLAPRPEQDRIVAEIEKQFTRLDAATAALKRVQANLKRYRASVLKAACEGRLVPTEAEVAREEGRDYEPAEKLLQRILRERRARWESDTVAKMIAAGKRPTDGRWKQKYKEPSAPDTSNLPALPEGWCWASLEQLTTLITSGSRGWGDSYSEAGPLFVRAQDIKTDSLNLDFVARVDLQTDSEGTRTRIFRNDILVTITGANVTKTALVTLDIEEAYVSQHVGLVRPVLPQIAAYLYTWIVSPSQGRKELLRLAYGAGKPGLNLENLRTLWVALPPIAEQIRLENETERLLSTAIAVESNVQHQIVKTSRARNGILQSAFTGQLVPQDPTDEPASALLERIRAGRVESLKKTVARRTEKKRGQR
jgi:type I restriction enzyme S subunit